jgi:hypothetical protein
MAKTEMVVFRLDRALAHEMDRTRGGLSRSTWLRMLVQQGVERSVQAPPQLCGSSHPGTGMCMEVPGHAGMHADRYGNAWGGATL